MACDNLLVLLLLVIVFLMLLPFVVKKEKKEEREERRYKKLDPKDVVKKYEIWRKEKGDKFNNKDVDCCEI